MLFIPLSCAVLKCMSKLSPVQMGGAQNSQTYQKRRMTAAKNPSQTLQPTPVRSAILNILLIVPRNRCLVLSKESFIVSVSFDESRISSPIASVICASCQHGTQCSEPCAARTSFSILTLPIMPSICSSVWLSIAARVASLY